MPKGKNQRSQKKYKMRGNKTYKKYGGDSNLALAYPSANVPTILNPNLAYTGKGGKGFPPTNTYASNNIYPSSGPPANGFNFLNSQIKSGGCGGSCPAVHHGGKRSRMNKKMRGGSSCSTSNNGIPYPNGLVGSPWTGNSNSWSGGKDVLPGGGNHFALNTYQNDVSRQMIDLGAAPPFTGGANRKKNKKSNKRRTKKNKSNKSNYKQKGGILSNLIGQDVVNLGRQFQYGVGSAYNGIRGFQAPVNPLPWKGQLTNTPSLSTIRASL